MTETTPHTDPSITQPALPRSLIYIACHTPTEHACTHRREAAIPPPSPNVAGTAPESFRWRRRRMSPPTPAGQHTPETGGGPDCPAHDAYAGRIRNGGEDAREGRTFSYIEAEIGVCHDVIRRALAERGYSTAPIRGKTGEARHWLLAQLRLTFIDRNWAFRKCGRPVWRFPMFLNRYNPRAAIAHRPTLGSVRGTTTALLVACGAAHFLRGQLRA